MKKVQIRLVLVVRLCGLVQVRYKFATSSGAVVIARCRVGKRVGVLDVQVGLHIIVYNVILGCKATVDQDVGEILLRGVRSVFSSKLIEILKLGIFLEVPADTNLIAY